MNDEKIPIYNPLTVDFSIKYDIKGDRNPKEFTIKGGEIQYFPKVIANHIKEALANEMFNQRGYLKDAHGNTELALEEYRKEIEVNLDE